MPFAMSGHLQTALIAPIGRSPYNRLFAQRYFGQGKAAGVVEGRVQGRTEGRAEGRVEIILKQLGARYGAV